MLFLSVSQEENHPFYDGINSYFALPFIESGEEIPEVFFRIPPLGPVLISTAFKKAGFGTAFFHNPLYLMREAEKLEKILREEKPDIAGISLTHIFREETLKKIISTIRDLSPGTAIIGGGAGMDYNPSFRGYFDMTFRGYAEGDILAFAEEKTGKRHSHRKSISAPDWEISGLKLTNLTLEGTRGCIGKCLFCTYGGGDFTFKDPDDIIAEMREWAEKGTDFFRFSDADFCSDAQRAEEICRKIISSGPRVNWSCFARSDTVNAPGLAELMKKAGCLWVFIGVESGSARILKNMKKGTSPGTVLKSISMLKSEGINVHGNFVVGFPGENDESLGETVSFIEKSELDTFYFSPFQIRSSGVHPELAGRFSLRGNNLEWEHRTMTSREAVEISRKLTFETGLSFRDKYIGNETLFSYIIRGKGDDFNRKKFAVLKAYRNYHLAAAEKNPGKKRESLSTLKRFLEA